MEATGEKRSIALNRGESTSSSRLFLIVNPIRVSSSSLPFLQSVAVLRSLFFSPASLQPYRRVYQVEISYFTENPNSNYLKSFIYLFISSSSSSSFFSPSIKIIESIFIPVN